MTPKGMAEAMLELAGLDTATEERLERYGYFLQPASMRHHLAEYGGLMKHSVNMTQRLVALTDELDVKWPRSESPYLVGMLHDLVKCRCYKLLNEDEDGKPKWGYIQPVYPGHGACSVAIAAELGIQLVREEVVAITYHMGLYGVGKEYTDIEFDNALRLHGPQVLATIYADWWAARVDEKGDEQ